MVSSKAEGMGVKGKVVESCLACSSQGPFMLTPQLGLCRNKVRYTFQFKTSKQTKTQNKCQVKLAELNYLRAAVMFPNEPKIDKLVDLRIAS